jgi:GNAT superfamily N-acetyltransferase
VFDLRAVPYDHPDAAALDAEVQDYYARLYGGSDATPMDPAGFLAPRGLFLVGYAAGVPVACGGWRACGEGQGAPLSTGDAEIKRMYVAAAHRGRGYARAVLAELERTAAAAGRRRIVLETGRPQPDAVALYASSGYEQMPNFGHYRDHPNSICFAKPLPASAEERTLFVR